MKSRNVKNPIYSKLGAVCIPDLTVNFLKVKVKAEGQNRCVSLRFDNPTEIIMP